MASASRPHRKSARISSPTPAKLNGHVVPTRVLVQEKGQSTLGAWIEPPLRAPVPSFMDHKGLERVGVLEGMMPLGAFPTTKSKAKAKVEPLRRSVHLRRLDNGKRASRRATPEQVQVGNTPEPNNKVVQESVSVGNPKEIETSQIKASRRQTSSSRSRQNSQQTPSLPSSPRVHTPQEPNIDYALEEAKAFDRAIEHAKQQNRHVLVRILEKLREGSDDSAFRATINKAASPPKTNGHNTMLETETAIAKTYKKQFRADMSLSPQKQTPIVPDRSKRLKISPPIAISSSPPSQPTLRISQPHAHHKQSTTLSPQIPHRDVLSPPVTLQMTENSTKAVRTLVLPDAKSTMGLSRRSSSSSLSSVDEAVVEQELPASNDDEVVLSSSNTDGFSSNPGFGGSLSGGVKRSSADIAQDEVLEAKRRKLTKSFEDYKVKESNIRPAPTTLRLSRPTTHSTQSLANEKSQPLTENGDKTNGDFESPASGPSTPGVSDLSQQMTPDFKLGRPKQLKSSARIKMSPLKKKSAVVAGVVRPENKRGGSVGYDDNSEQSDNNDYCSACHGTGYLLCCDGCDRSFHFSCLDPPLDQDAELDEPWFCYICKARQEPPPPQPRGLFADLIYRIEKKNPAAFELPERLRNYFEGVRTGEDGEYEEPTQQKHNTRGRMGYDEQPDLRKTKDSKGKTILCYRCSKSSLDGRDIIACDWCSLHWHLDCLDPPLANPPNRSGLDGKMRQAWMCPNHIDHDLRHLDPVQTSGVSYDGVARTHRVRRPKNAKIVDTALRRGHRNNGLIEVEDSSSEEEDAFTEEEYSNDDGPQIKRLPRKGIKLDFIDKIKSARIVRRQAEAAREQTASANAAEMILRNEQATAENQMRLTEDLRRRSFLEQKLALNLVQFASQNSDLNLGPRDVDNLINVLTAESPADVVSKMTEGEVAAAASRNVIIKTSEPPSPPASDQPDSVAISESERSRLLRLQELIRRKLEMASVTHG